MREPYVDYNYLSTKTYGHEQGLSCAFRQPKAIHSHCSLLHGYALSFSFQFGCEQLDDKNWVVDFGGLKDLKEWLKDNFDHQIAVDKDDPDIDRIIRLQEEGLAEEIVMNGFLAGELPIGCPPCSDGPFFYTGRITLTLVTNCYNFSFGIMLYSS